MMLRAEGATVRLGGRAVLKEFSTVIGPGEFVAVVGPNGAGKSTALKLMAGLIAPETGGVTLDGAPIAGIAAKERAKRLAYLPQDRTVHWPLAAERVVALGRLPHRSFAAGESARDRECVAAAMARMDVAQFADRSVTTLSGGERARVLVARALAQEADILIADEPAAGLDPAHVLALFHEFARLSRDGHGVLTALHDLSLAVRFATRVILLREGVCLADGQPAQVLSKQNVARAFGVDAIVTEIDGIPVVLPHAGIIGPAP
jgi:iron complex transport system ATP-binding protein